MSDKNHTGLRIPFVKSEIVVSNEARLTKSSLVKKFPALKSGLKTGDWCFWKR